MYIYVFVIYLNKYIAVSRLLPLVQNVINGCSPSHADFFSDLTFYDQQLYIYIYTYNTIVYNII